MDNNASSNFNFVAGVFGFAITIISAAACCRTYLPGAQIKILDELLKETRMIYEKANDDDLFPSDAFREVSLGMLTDAEESSALLREQTYNATTALQEYLALFSGLSQSIMQLSASVKALRASLISTSEKERRQRRAGDSARLNDSTIDSSISQWLTPVDFALNMERSTQEVSHSSDGQPTSRLSDSLTQLDDSHRQEVDRNEASGVREISSAPEIISDLSRSPTLVVTQPPSIFCRTLDRLRGCMRINPNKGALDASAQIHDVARLPV